MQVRSCCHQPASPERKSIFVSEASVCRILKFYDLITSPAYVVVSAADEFQDKTKRPNQLWQTGFTYLKVTGRRRTFSAQHIVNIPFK
jgi:hypothetical protein